MGGLLIAGIDPGTTVGYALLDITGRLVAAGSGKTLALPALIEAARMQGKPLIVGTDKRQVPGMVSAFAAKFGARIVSPPEDIAVAEKQAIAAGIAVRNAHERDALAAALYAYRHFEKLLTKIIYHLREFDAGTVQRVSELCVKEGMNIALALDIVTKPDDDIVAQLPKVLPQEERRDELNFIYSRLKRAEKEAGLLRQQNAGLQDESARLEKQVSLLAKKQQPGDHDLQRLLSLREERIKSLQSDLRSREQGMRLLQQQLEKYRTLLIGSNAYLVAKRLSTLGHEEFQRKKRILQLQHGDILFVETLDIINNRILEQLRGKVRTIIYRSRRQQWPMPDFTLIPSEKLSLIEDKYFVLVRKEDLEREQNSMETMRTLIADYKDRFRLARTHEHTLP
ncbi:DUF460 domain-containing protein [Candidatus Woesearchaeota archaeon]|nr:DUF460 domain-containing protein [Candidatus Woesearchaeota archaeon]